MGVGGGGGGGRHAALSGPADVTWGGGGIRPVATL